MGGGGVKIGNYPKHQALPTDAYIIGSNPVYKSREQLVAFSPRATRVEVATVNPQGSPQQLATSQRYILFLLN
jgi:hypothetical protein